MSASGLNNKDVPDNPEKSEGPKSGSVLAANNDKYIKGFANNRDDPDVAGESSSMGSARMLAIKDEENFKEHSKEQPEEQPIASPKEKLKFQLKSEPTVALQSLQKLKELSVSLDGAADNKGKHKQEAPDEVGIESATSHKNENKAIQDHAPVSGQDEAGNAATTSSDDDPGAAKSDTPGRPTISLTFSSLTEASRLGRRRLENAKKSLKGKERRTSADSIESAEFVIIKSRTWSVPSNSTIPAAPILTPESVLAWPTHGLVFDDETVDEATMRHMERWRQINRDEDQTEVDEYTQRLGYGRRWSIATEGLINSREALKEMAKKKAEQEELERKAREKREAERQARMEKWERERVERERRLEERLERERLMRGGRGAGRGAGRR